MKVTVAEVFYFWGTHGGAELDLLLFKNGKCFGFEFKCNSDKDLALKQIKKKNYFENIRAKDKILDKRKISWTSLFK